MRQLDGHVDDEADDVGEADDGEAEDDVHPSGGRVWVEVTAERVGGMPGGVVDVGNNEAAILCMGAGVADGRLCGLGDPRPIVLNFC